jgi:hypothetical protein
MNRLTRPIRFALMALSVLACGRPALAQQPPPKDLVPFKITVSGKADVFVIPVEPPVASSRMMLKGTSDLLAGEVTLTDMHTFNLGVDGAPNRSTNGIGAFTTPSGDALFVYWDAALRPTTTPNVVQGIAGFTIRGGKGKFAGVTGSGVFNSTVNAATLEVNQVWEGMIAITKK